VRADLSAGNGVCGDHVDGGLGKLLEEEAGSVNLDAGVIDQYCRICDQVVARIARASFRRSSELMPAQRAFDFSRTPARSCPDVAGTTSQPLSAFLG